MKPEREPSEEKKDGEKKRESVRLLEEMDEREVRESGVVLVGEQNWILSS